MTNPKAVPPEKIVGKIIGSCTAQANYYASNPEKMYFVAKHDVLTALTDRIISNYEDNKATIKEHPLWERDRTYMTFHRWIMSEAFSKNIGPKYLFSEPFIVGSAWTPLRRDDSTVDVILIVSTSEGYVQTLPDDVMDIFVRAFCKEFLIYDIDEVYVRKNKLTFEAENFRITVRLTPLRCPPFAARLTSAMCLYDDFLDNFSALAFFIHHWFRGIRDRAKGSEKLVVPDPFVSEIAFNQYE